MVLSEQTEQVSKMHKSRAFDEDLRNDRTRERVTSLRSYNKIPRYCPERQRTVGWKNLTLLDQHLG